MYGMPLGGAQAATHDTLASALIKFPAGGFTLCWSVHGLAWVQHPRGNGTHQAGVSPSMSAIRLCMHWWAAVANRLQKTLLTGPSIYTLSSFLATASVRACLLCPPHCRSKFTRLSCPVVLLVPHAKTARPRPSERLCCTKSGCMASTHACHRHGCGGSNALLCCIEKKEAVSPHGRCVLRCL